MSFSARRAHRANRRLCPCGRHALYFRPGGHGVSYRPDHPLCPACWASLRDHDRAMRTPWRRAVLVRLPEPMREAA